LGLWRYVVYTKRFMFHANKVSQLHYYNPCANNCFAYFSECYDYINILKRKVFVLVLPFSAYPETRRAPLYDSLSQWSGGCALVSPKGCLLEHYSAFKSFLSVKYVKSTSCVIEARLIYSAFA